MEFVLWFMNNYVHPPEKSAPAAADDTAIDAKRHGALSETRMQSGSILNIARMHPPEEHELNDNMNSKKILRPQQQGQKKTSPAATI